MPRLSIQHTLVVLILSLAFAAFSCKKAPEPAPAGEGSADEPTITTKETNTLFKIQYKRENGKVSFEIEQNKVKVLDENWQDVPLPEGFEITVDIEENKVRISTISGEPFIFQKPVDDPHTATDFTEIEVNFLELTFSTIEKVDDAVSIHFSFGSGSYDNNSAFTNLKKIFEQIKLKDKPA